jgi:hypothetical protein
LHKQHSANNSYLRQLIDFIYSADDESLTLLATTPEGQVDTASLVFISYPELTSPTLQTPVGRATESQRYSAEMFLADPNVQIRARTKELLEITSSKSTPS